MFVFFFFLLGLTFGYAVRMPWCLLAFVVPGLLALAASDRSASAMVIGFAVTAAGIVLGVVLATREREREQHA